MSECCSQGNQQNSSARCPCHGRACREVPYRTLLHHLKTPWHLKMVSQRYYFCDEAMCPVIYFGEDGQCFEQDALRERVGHKQRAGEDMLCYCFDIRYADARENLSLKGYVLEQTRANLCHCDIRNPSGRCCLKDFPK